MVRNRIVEAIQEATGNAEIAFKIFSIVKFQKFTEMKDVDENKGTIDDITKTIMERD